MSKFDKLKAEIDKSILLDGYNYDNLTLIDVIFNIKRRFELIEPYSKGYDLTLRKEYLEKLFKKKGLNAEKETGHILEYDIEILNQLLPTSKLLKSKSKKVKKLKSIFAEIKSQPKDFSKNLFTKVLSHPIVSAPECFIEGYKEWSELMHLHLSEDSSQTKENEISVNTLTYADVCSSYHSFNGTLIANKNLTTKERQLFKLWENSEELLHSPNYSEFKFQNYNKEITELTKQNTNDFYNEPIYKICRSKYIHLKIDMRKPNNQIRDDLIKVINSIRRNFDFPVTHGLSPDYVNNLIHKLADYKIFEFFDLSLWAAINKTKITQENMALLLFLDNDEIDTKNRISQTVDYWVAEYVSEEFIKSLETKYNQIQFKS